MFRFKPVAIIRGFAVLTLLLALPLVSAIAQPVPMFVPCADRSAVVDILGKQYGEQRRGLGLTSAGRILEIFVAQDGHWTALLSSADGTACMIATGEGWQEEKPAAGEQS